MGQALPSVAIVGIWLVIGYYMVIFLAAIKDIPPAYFEAAEIDGASSW
jgi:multiple sugar transport system permease protein